MKKIGKTLQFIFLQKSNSKNPDASLLTQIINFLIVRENKPLKINATAIMTVVFYLLILLKWTMTKI